MALTNAGRDAICGLIIGDATNNYNATNGYLSVGDSTTAFANTQTELQAVTNRTRKQLTSSTRATNVISFVTTYASGDANYSWQEFGTFNAVGTGGPPVTGGTMLHRVVSNQGTKVAGQSWQLTMALTITVP